jgi:serine protease Do
MSQLFNRRTLFVIIAALLIIPFAAGCKALGSVQAAQTTLAAPTSASPPGTSVPATPTTAPAAPVVPLSGFSTAIRDVASRVKPAVVQITNEQVQVDQFDQPYTVPAGVGSGVIYDGKGDILTNDHVVEGAQKLLVSLPDGRSFQAKLIGQDPETDLAVVQISGSNLPVAELGDSSQLQVGDWLVAIGNALALPGGPTVTVGVASALGRTVQEPSSTGGAGPFLFDVIQTSAPINPGNSGGPLVNLAGQVVGINTLVAGQAEPGVQAQGIGFAIAISTAKPIADQLVTSGHATHPYVGIRYVPLNPAISAQIGIQQTQGIVISDVVAGSPADKAGLLVKDVVTAIDHTPLQGDSALAQAINAHKVGDTITLTVLRGSQKLSLKVTLGALPSS